MKNRRRFLSLVGTGTIAALGAIASSKLMASVTAQEITPVPIDVEQLARLTSVRILTSRSSGSGILVQRQGNIYTLLTNWHVFAFSDRPSILTVDGQQYPLLEAPQQLGGADTALCAAMRDSIESLKPYTTTLFPIPYYLFPSAKRYMAIARFSSRLPYEVAPLSPYPATVGEPVYAAGFPMYHWGTVQPTFDLGVRAFRLTWGTVSLVLNKSLAQGYRLGYTNRIESGMSGGPIFSDRGLLLGINGRLANRDPGFGVYIFEDGTAPSPALLEQILQASWGIPIDTYRATRPYPRQRPQPLYW
ncbi:MULTISPECIES: serine protease [unclassified Roseofilum]|nr:MULTISPECIES: serine protease [unclassified Roseofilum]